MIVRGQSLNLEACNLALRRELADAKIQEIVWLLREKQYLCSV